MRLELATIWHQATFRDENAMKNNSDARNPVPRFTGLIPQGMLAVILLFGLLSAHADGVSFTPLSKGGVVPTKIGSQQLDLSPVRPPVVKRLPKSVTAPYF